jgi:hypothetical protein
LRTWSRSGLTCPWSVALSATRFGLASSWHKVRATMDTQYPGGKRSTRVKDLVDLVVIAHTQTVDLDELRVSIASKRELSSLNRRVPHLTDPFVILLDRALSVGRVP